MAEWVISTAVGTGETGFGGDGGPAEKALLNGPFDVAFDGGGNLFFSDTFNNRIRRVDARSGVITTVAGNGDKGFGGDGGPAIAAALNEPYGVVLDRSGNLYVADRLNRRVRRVDAASGVITTIAGTGEAAYGGDGGPSEKAGLAEPNGLAFDPGQTRLYITDVADNRVRVIGTASGVISTFAGTGAGQHSGDGGLAVAAGTFGARAVKVGADGIVYILERQGSSLRAVDGRGIITTIAGTTARGYSGDGGQALAAVFDAPKEMAIDRDGNLLIVDTENHAIRIIDRRTMVVTNLAGGRQGGGGDGGAAGEAGLDRPHGAVVGADGAVWIGDTNNHRVRKVAKAA